MDRGKPPAGTAGKESPRVEHLALPRLLSRQSLIHEFKEHLPIWMVYVSAVGMLHATLANFPEQGFAQVGIPRKVFFATTPFPLVWFTAYFILRIRRSRRWVRRWKAYLALAVLVIGVPCLIFFFYQPYPFTHDQLTDLFEATAFVWTALLVVHLLLGRGRQALVLFFGVTFVFGLLLENAGIIFAFFSEPSFRIYLWFLPAPLCTMLGWCLAFTIVISVTDRLGEWVAWLSPSKGVWPRVGAATAMALCLDAQLDPLASMSGVLWKWNEQLPQVFFGVPLVNFAAWFGAVSVFSYFVFKVRSHDDWSPSRKNRELFLRVPLACVLAWALCFVVLAVAEGGIDGPSFQILRAFVERLLGP